MSLKTQPIPFNQSSSVWFAGEIPTPYKLFYYVLNRCIAKKAHCCGETWLQANNRLCPSQKHPAGVKCGFKEGDTIVAWRYRESFSKEEQKSSSTEKKAALSWSDFNKQNVPAPTRPFHFKLQECDEIHASCGIGEREADNKVLITTSACALEAQTSLNLEESCDTFDRWSYLRA